MVSSHSLATEQSIGGNVVLIGEALDWIPDPEIELLPEILPFPYCRSHIPHALVVQ